jgi:predicted dehydrogenase
MVDICTPTYLHAPQAVQIMDRGIHVLCEKPMALSVEDANLMLQASKRNDVFFMVAHVIRFWPEYMYLKEVFNDGKYGPLNHLFFSRTLPIPEWSWNNWMLDDKTSGRGVVDVHIHDTDFILHMLGAPKSVSSFGKEQERDISYIMTDYEYDGFLVQAEGGWFRHSSPFKMTFRASFEKATLEYSNSKLMLYQNNHEPQEIQLNKQDLTSQKSSDVNINSLGAYYNEIDYFINCIRNNTPPKISTPKSSLESLLWVAKELESARSGTRVHA